MTEQMRMGMICLALCLLATPLLAASGTVNVFILAGQSYLHAAARRGCQRT